MCAVKRLPALFMRGGTSKAVVMRAADIPEDPAARDAAFLRIMGSPDPNGRQLNGMGGGISSLSKICILAKSAREDADIDYTFAQIPVGGTRVDYNANCGNMSAAMGPAALEMGLIEAADGEGRVRIFNTNTSKLIHAHFPIKNGLLDDEGTFRIDGVSGEAAPIRLDFINPGGARTGRLLPTGQVVDQLTLPDGTKVAASCVDAANPCVFVAAASLGVTGAELPTELDADPQLRARLEAVRQAASVAMGIAPDLAAAAEILSAPKIALVAPPAAARLLSGETLPPERQSLLVRMISMGDAHRAVPVTGAVCVAVAARIAGTLPAQMMREIEGRIVVAHASGTLEVDAVVKGAQDPAKAVAAHGSVFRTARLLFKGEVCL